MQNKYFKNTVVWLTVLSGFICYSNLFCAEHHKQYFHARECSSFESVIKYHYVIEDHHDPFHDLYHSNQIVTDETYDSSYYISGFFYNPPSVSGVAFHKTPADRHLKSEKLKFLTLKAQTRVIDQLII